MLSQVADKLYAAKCLEFVLNLPRHEMRCEQKLAGAHNYSVVRIVIRIVW